MKKTLITSAHALVGWALCGAVIAVGRNLMPMGTVLIIHAVAAPVFFALISILFHRKFAYLSPIGAAAVFTGIVILIDAGLVAPVFEKNWDMFRSVLGTWIPFVLIFASSWASGKAVRRRNGVEPVN